MKAIRFRLAATLTALALATGCAAPAVFAKSSGFSVSSSHSSFSSGSARSYSSSSSSSSSSNSSSRSSASLSSVSQASGFSSTGSSKSLATTALGSSLYAAQSSRDAGATLNSSQSSRNVVSGTTPSGGGSGGTPSYGAASYAPTSPSYSAPAYIAPAAPTVVVQQSSGSNPFLLGWLLGHDSSPRETVVVQQPTAPAVTSSTAPVYRDATAGNAASPSNNDASGARAENVDPSATTTQQPEQESHHPVLTALKWIAGLGVVGVLLALAHRVWSARKARFSSHTNYRL